MRLLSFVCVCVSAIGVWGQGIDDPFDKSGVPLEVDTGDASLKKIVLLAGAPSSKPLGHEYFAGCALFADWLGQTPGLHPVIAWDGWPANEEIFENASAVVFYMDGGAKIPFLEPKRWAVIRRLEAKGVGLVFLHQMVEFPKERADEALKWLGGVFENGKGGRGHWESAFEAFPKHPVSRGLKPFKINDGWLYGLRLAEDAKGKLTPILVTRPPDSSRSSDASKRNSGQEETIAWTYERANGGRSFGFTAADWHPSWAVESVRRATINGILWTAGVDIPKDGAPVKLAKGALNRNLDDKRKGQKAIGTKLNPNMKYLAPASMPGIVLDELQGEMKGTWTGSTASGPVIVGRNYFHDGGKNKGECSIVFRPAIPVAGKYEITLYAQPHANRSPKVPVVVAVEGLSANTVNVDQRDAAKEARHSLGTFDLPRGSKVTVTIDNAGTTGIVVVDALQVTPVKK
jgi:hypothetical protein